jgi:hypothetical protein
MSLASPPPRTRSYVDIGNDPELYRLLRAEIEKRRESLNVTVRDLLRQQLRKAPTEDAA